FRTFKVVYIGYAALTILIDHAVEAGDEVCKFAVHRNERRGLGINARYFIYKPCDEIRLRGIVYIQPPYPVAGGLITDIDLLCERPLVQVHDGSPDLEGLAELVVHMGAEQSLLLYIEGSVILQRDIDGQAGVENAFVDDLHLTRGIVHGI